MLRIVVALAFVTYLLSPAYGGRDRTKSIERDEFGGTNFVTFRGGELAVIALAGDVRRKVSIKVYDADDTLVAEDSGKDDSHPSLALVTFVPRKTAKYKVVLEWIGEHSWKTN